MTARNFIVRVRYALRQSRLLQMGLLVGFWMIGEGLASATGLPIPGGVVGLGLVFLLLATKRLRLSSIKRGADWFLAEIILFFLPAILAVLEHGEFVGLLGLKLLALIVIGTLVVMSVTAVTVDLCHRWQEDHGPPPRAG